MGTITSASISKKVIKVLVYMCTKFGAFFIKYTIDLVCRCTKPSDMRRARKIPFSFATFSTINLTCVRVLHWDKESSNEIFS